MSSPQLTLEDYAYRVRWLEQARTIGYLSPTEQRKAWRKLITKCANNDSGLLRDGVRTEWTAMVEGWYRQEYPQATTLA